MPNPTPDCCFIPLIYNTLSATDPTASSHPHSHLPTVALSNATFGYSKLSELPQCCHGATTELPRSRHGAATERLRSGYGATTVLPRIPRHSPIPIPISPQSLYLMPPSATQSHQSCHGAATEPPQSCHGSHGIIPSHPHLPTLALPNATFGYSKSSELPRNCHRATTELPWIPRHHPISSPSPHSRST